MPFLTLQSSFESTSHVYLATIHFYLHGVERHPNFNPVSKRAYEHHALLSNRESMKDSNNVK